MHADLIAAAIRDPRFVARFWNKVSKTDECWLWKGRKNGHGYGIADLPWRCGKPQPRQRAHRVAWTISNGNLPDDTRWGSSRGTLVLHRCDNPACVRPSHLFVGTQTDNNADMRAKGREGRPETRGEHNSNSRLTDADVREIRKRFSGGEHYKSIGLAFGINPMYVHEIASRSVWSHLK